ncbi:hypothetical protein KCU94_g232, partial [Aureobasidium melanogenum]
MVRAQNHPVQHVSASHLPIWHIICKTSEGTIAGCRRYSKSGSGLKCRGLSKSGKGHGEPVRVDDDKISLFDNLGYPPTFDTPSTRTTAI